MGIRDALDRAVGRVRAGELAHALQKEGIALADEEAMSHAIHACYCGPRPDHFDPNEKDREQARAMLAALARHSS